MSGKVRLDTLLVELGLAPSRQKAQALIIAGKVYQGEKRLDKPGQTLARSSEVSVRNPEQQWASRGALKLLHGLEHFLFKPEGLTVADIGASTGGFTDVLLSQGAKKVFAIDVGYGQLEWRLRTDERVCVMEKTNARHLTFEQVGELFDALVCDASFISLTTLLPKPLKLLKPGGWVILLIKPQFEAQKTDVGRQGVVKDPEVHDRVCQKIVKWFEEQKNWKINGITPSPLLGPKGNREFLIGLEKNNN